MVNIDCQRCNRQHLYPNEQTFHQVITVKAIEIKGCPNPGPPNGDKQSDEPQEFPPTNVLAEIN